MATISTDGPLAVARRRLDGAVSALADPVAVCVGGGAYRWCPSLYAQLRGALQGTIAPVRRARVSRSRLPCRTDVLTLLIEIDRAVGGWAPDGKSTIERLHQLAARGWRPQDCELMDGYCDRIGQWVLAAAGLITPAPRMFLERLCPTCGAQFAYRRNGSGESMRTRALRVSEDGCECGACGAFWGPDQFHWLARLLGCPAVPA